jgi:hypothetical protein
MEYDGNHTMEQEFFSERGDKEPLRERVDLVPLSESRH